MYTSQLWGLVVGVEGAFQGKFKVNTVMDIWQRCKEEGCPGDPGSSGYWSSVLESVTWLDQKDDGEKDTWDNIVLTFVDQLKYPHGDSSPAAETLYIKFTVDMMNEDPRTRNFAHGRVIGSISTVGDVETQKLGFPEFNRMLWGQGLITALNGQPTLPQMMDYYHAPFYIDEKNYKFVVDLSNSLPTHLNGSLVDRGNLLLLLIYRRDSLKWENGMIKNCDDILHNPEINVGTIGYTADEWLRQDAGIVIMDIAGQDPKEHNVVVMVVKEEAPPCQQCQKQCLPVLVEHHKGLYIGAAEDRVFRIPEPNTESKRTGEDDDKVSWTLKIFATQFGKPAKNTKLNVKLNTDRNDICIPTDAITLGPDYESFHTSPGQFITNYQGLASITFTTNREGLDCSNPDLETRRGYQVDGQLYVYDITVQPKGDTDVAFPQNLKTTIHLYCKHESKPPYTWVDDIYPICQQYDNLYPVMKPLFNLASYREVVRDSTRKQLLHSLQLPIEDPNHMPVTRDLSPAKKDMLVHWLKQHDRKYSLEDQATRLAELKENLQLALRLELATIPPYLSAYFSIKDGFNTKVASLLKDIVVQEMYHMALVANILNAIGGTPVLNDPDLLPTYPGPLPGGCRPELNIQLAKCSLHQIHDVFMAIEKPECLVNAYSHIFDILDDDVSYMSNSRSDDSRCLLLETNVEKKCKDDVKNYDPDTIGAIYIHRILCPMIDLYANGSGSLTFDKDTTKQYPAPFKVTDVCTAIMAVHQITDQGEGGHPCDPFYKGPGGEDELSHYYKFAEIAHGKALVTAQCHNAYTEQGQNGHSGEQCRHVHEKSKHDSFTPCGICCDTKYEFAGAPIPFYENAVWPTLPNPSSSKYPPGSRARKMSDRFNEKYTSLLICLHDMFNGNPRNMKKCFGLMSSLTVDAKKMVQTPIDPDGDPNIGPNVAPTFEWYPPVN
ncbi:uncharacterized protein LOC118409176 [Branchiostoma floridae]|uniref:Uncharacterized protein LOC118409176 n=1 Tax=Branchiostoma floridae TaxID=7739 RepID=A0A9J7HUS2_BRAFL|nr:uncharacterized protein LOC118409176 [Branchiostoma floridae]